MVRFAIILWLELRQSLLLRQENHSFIHREHKSIRITISSWREKVNLDLFNVFSMNRETTVDSSIRVYIAYGIKFLVNIVYVYCFYVLIFYYFIEYL